MLQPFMIRLLIGCLLVWLIDFTMGAFGVAELPRKIILIVTLILAWVYILFGWALHFS